MMKDSMLKCSGNSTLSQKIASIGVSLTNTISARSIFKKMFDLGSDCEHELSDGFLKRINCTHSESEIKRILNESQDNQINITTVYDSNYPKALLTIPDPPAVIYTRGSLSNNFQSSVAIVGSRNADRLGLEIAHQCASWVTKRAGCVVSGLALGVDGAAHRGALECDNNDQPTIAVLAHGLESVYPSRHSRLACEILERGGALVSQFALGVPSLPHHFLDRNRVISGLACTTLVIQARSKSGSLVTAKHALEQGREVCAIPWNVTNPRAYGTNKLIKAGAGIVTRPEDLKEYLELAEYGQPNTNDESNQNLNPVMQVLKKEDGLSIHDLVEKLELPESELRAQILELEIAGFVRISASQLVELTKIL